MKDVIRRRYASGRCLITFDPEISEWGNLMRVILHGYTEHSDNAYSGKWNISVPGGKENKSYSASSGERKQRSPNQCTTLYLIYCCEFFRGDKIDRIWSFNRDGLCRMETFKDETRGALLHRKTWRLMKKAYFISGVSSYRKGATKLCAYSFVESGMVLGIMPQTWEKLHPPPQPICGMWKVKMLSTL